MRSECIQIRNRRPSTYGNLKPLVHESHQRGVRGRHRNARIGERVEERRVLFVLVLLCRSRRDQRSSPARVRTPAPPHLRPRPRVIDEVRAAEERRDDRRPALHRDVRLRRTGARRPHATSHALPSCSHLSHPILTQSRLTNFSLVPYCLLPVAHVLSYDE